jgi:hypothetical protein
MGYLGKRFQQNIKATLDENYIAWALRGIEKIKLEILDSVEGFEQPPYFGGMMWLQKLYNHRDYQFVWNELNKWLDHNGLGWYFEDLYQDGEKVDVRFVIRVSMGRDFNTVPDLDFHSWLENVKK